MTLIISFSLTLLIFSYLLGDNFLYRLAVSGFVGLTAGFTTIAIFKSAVLPFLLINFNENPYAREVFWLFIISLFLAGTLLLKPVSALKSITNVALAFLIAVGSAVALVGALTGTIIPFIADTTSIDFSTTMTIVNSIIILIGVVTSLFYFRYQAKQNPDGTITHSRLVNIVRNIGQGFIVVTLGAIYATAILTSLTILTGQISSLFAS